MQRIIGVLIGAVVTWVLLWLLVGSENTANYTTAVVVGGIVSAAWPWVIGLLLVRRAKNRRDEQIQKEVDAQMKARGG
jgi:ABC-type uncharacterized transport system permease subunit